MLVADIFVQKTRTPLGYCLVPCHQSDLDAIKKLPTDPLRVKVTRPRNVAFHRKLFALFNYLYDIWEPDEGNQVGEKCFDRFRQDLTILAGFYEQHVRLDGSTRVEAKSISFGKMDQDEFEELYSKVIDVGIKYVANNHTGEELRAVIDTILSFDGNGL